MIATQTKQHQVGSELNSDMTDVIHEWVPMCLSIQIRQFKRLDNPSQRRRSYNQVKNKQNCRVSSNHKMGKKHTMVPPLNHFQWKNEYCSSLARTISTLRRSFFANLTTFEPRSGLKKIFLLKIAILKMG